MNKFIFGIISGFGVMGLGKWIYDKGRKDMGKDVINQCDNIIQGMRFNNESKKEVEEGS